jgi:two-component system, OmpR family, sensor kinase
LTLRLRLVLALVALVAIAQGIFLFATYTVYKNSQYQNLDNQLRNIEPSIDNQLDAQLLQSTTGSDGQGGPPPGAQPGPQDQHGPPEGTCAYLVNSDGVVRAQILLSNAQPKIPTTLPPLGAGGHTFFTVGATSGPGSFRVMETRGQNGVTLVAIPTTEVTNALHRLLLIELSALAALLVVLSSGAWLVLRRGLRPLERMAGTARLISAGDLSQRVPASTGAGEVEQLGRAFNTMLTDIESAFAEREATEARLRQFLADASHELRTPLTSIRGFAELFRVSGDNAAVDLPTILRRIEEESARMKVLVDDLLLLARLDEKRELHPAPVDLAVLAADACSDAVAIDRNRAVTLDAPEPVVVAADETHVRQALSNLVANAIRHTPPGSAIDVGARMVQGEAVVTVRDHGPGLDDESLAHVFDRFWQGDKARTGSGAGLGLSIVAAVAAEHGGRATAENADGGGARFTLRLPVNSRAAPEGARTPSPLPI